MPTCVPALGKQPGLGLVVPTWATKEGGLLQLCTRVQQLGVDQPVVIRAECGQATRKYGVAIREAGEHNGLQGHLLGTPGLMLGVELDNRATLIVHHGAPPPLPVFVGVVKERGHHCEFSEDVVWHVRRKQPQTDVVVGIALLAVTAASSARQRKEVDCANRNTVHGWNRTTTCCGLTSFEEHTTIPNWVWRCSGQTVEEQSRHARK